MFDKKIALIAVANLAVYLGVVKGLDTYYHNRYLQNSKETKFDFTETWNRGYASGVEATLMSADIWASNGHTLKEFIEAHDDVREN